MTTRYHPGMRGATLTLHVSASSRLRLVVASLHVLAACAVLGADLAAGFQVAILAVLIGSLVRSLRPAPPVVLCCQPDGALSVGAGEAGQTVEILPDTVVLAWLVVLRYRSTAGTRPDTVVILGDSLDREEFRRLRIWLKWRAALSDRKAQA
ncbi:MAG: hypothetical protein HGA75_02055 [Thiobacillus sp.]|nr:hypothetical protein [Thiobacillus sp.]